MNAPYHWLAESRRGASANNDRAASTLATTLLFAGSGLLAYAFYSGVVGGYWVRGIGFVIFGATILVARSFAARGEIKMAGAIAVPALVLGLALSAVAGNGLASPGLAAIILMNALVAMVFGRRWLLGMLAASTLVLLILNFEWLRPWIPATEVSRDVNLAGFLAVIGTLGIMLDRFAADARATNRRLDEMAAAQRRREEFLDRQFAAAKELLRGDALHEGDSVRAFRAVTEAACHVVQVDRASVWRHDGARNALVCSDLLARGADHSSGQELAASDYPRYLEALAAERVLAINDARTDPRTAEFALHYAAAHEVGAMLDVPVVRGGAVVALLCLEHVGPAREWTVEERSFAATLGDFVRIAIESESRVRGREEATENLRRSEEKFALLFNDSPTPLTLREVASGVIMDANAAWLRRNGRTREELIGRVAAEEGDGGDRVWVGKVLAETRGTEAPVGPWHVVLHSKDGKSYPAEVMGSAVLHLGGKRVRIWSTFDMSERARAEEEIRALNESLARRVEERTAELEKSNRELESTIAILRNAQDELVRSEKMAALGSLVAGVAHELNTPIGNSLLLASTLQERSERFSQEIATGSIRRSTLASFTSDSARASELLVRSLSHAAELVSDFKQVAVDQASAKRREFDLKEVIEEVLATLQHLVKRRSVEVRVALAEKVWMDSYPGPLGQVLINFFNNALLHGFDGREHGEIRIETRALGEDRAVIEFVDDGNGIAAEHLDRLFDPFFTTKLGQGGTGLGLNIVHGIVTQLLGGTILVESKPERGTRFIVELPRVASPPG